jgi:hypothetical protein
LAGQVKVQVRGAKGIPVPDDDRAGDVLRRNLRACLFLENPDKKKHSRFIGNTYVTMAKQDANYEECWQFPDTEFSDSSMILRCDLKVRNPPRWCC